MPGADRRRGRVELGRHDGLWRFTPGQRRGIGARRAGAALRPPRRRATNTLVVGPAQRARGARGRGRGRLYLPVERAEAKLRYRSEPCRRVVEATGDGFALDLDEPVEAVAPGQVAVLYDDDAVVGAGVIERATG